MSRHTASFSLGTLYYAEGYRRADYSRWAPNVTPNLEPPFYEMWAASRYAPGGLTGAAPAANRGAQVGTQLQQMRRVA